MPSPASRHAILLACMTIVSGCTTGTRPSPNLVADFSDMSDTKFTIQADAPPAIVREYTICKAVLFASKMHKTSLSLSNPKYSEPTEIAGGIARVPSGWTRLTATAYLTGANPDGNPTILVADKAPICRAGFDWYR